MRLQRNDLSNPVSVRNSIMSSIRPRLLSGSLGLAVTGSLSAGAAMAHPFSVAPHQPVTAHPFPGLSGGSHSHASIPSFTTSTVVHSVSATTLGAASAAATSSTNAAGVWNPAGNAHFHSQQGAKYFNPNFNNTVAAPQDLRLNSTAHTFSAGSLAGFHQITIDIGGKQQVLDVNSKLTAAELVAAQQVLSGGRQDITLNAHGVATGGKFDLNDATLSALGTATGGSIGTLFVTRGVTAIDTLSNLSLTGALVNLGTIDMGAALGAKGQTVDTVSASRIVNLGTGVIASAEHLSGVTPTGISLIASGDITNSGKVTSTSSLNLTAPIVNNAGTLTATTGSVNLSGVGGSLFVDNTGGTIQATHGNINLDSGAASGNITASGGNWLSQAINFNAGAGNVEANIGEVTGVINGTAGCAHVSAATQNLQLGDLNVSGDPSYFNTAGDVTIDGTVGTTTGFALAIVASGNIIANGGTLDTSSASGGGALTLIAGANVTSDGGSSGSNNSKDTLTITDSLANPNLGSKTGGYIDLSGITLTGKPSNAPVLAVTTNGGVGKAGDILMVAYKGTGTNSGAIVATESAKQTGGADKVQAVGIAGDGNVTMIAPGGQITAKDIHGGTIVVLAATPTVQGTPVKIQDGNILSGSFGATGPFTNTAINIANISTGGDVTIATGGATSSTALNPLTLNAASLTFTGSGKSSSLYVTAPGALTLNPGSAASVAGTLSVLVTGPGDITIANKITGTGNVILNATNGNITGSGTIFGTSASLTASGNIGIDASTRLVVGVSTLTLSAGGSVFAKEVVGSGKALSLLTSNAGGASFDLISDLPLTINGPLTVNNGSAVITETEATLNTINGTTTVAGITIAKPIVVSPGGSIALATTGNENIVEKSTVLAANAISVTAGGAVGTSSAPFITQTAQVSLTANSSNNIYLKDTSALNFVLVASPPSVSGGLISVISAAKNFGISSLPFSEVIVSDPTAGGTTTLTGSAIGDGSAASKVTMTINGNIASAGGFISADTAVLTSSAGSIGAKGADLPANVSTLTANAAKGSVFISSAANTTLNSGAALTTYHVDGNIINLNGMVKATDKTGTVEFSISKLMTQASATAVLSAANVSLQSTGVNSAIGQGPGFQAIATKATQNLTMTSNGAGSQMFVTQAGNTILNTISTGSLNSSLNLAITGGSLTVNGTIGFDNLTLTSNTGVTVGTAGIIDAVNLTVNTPVVVVKNTNPTFGQGSINIIPGGSTTFSSPAALSITGPGVVTLGASLALIGPSGITLGDAAGKTPGQNNPLANIGKAGGSLTNLSITTAGIFTGAYTSFVLDAGAKDSISITAASLKNSGPAVLTPFILSANGSADVGNASNSVILNLTGSGNVVLDTQNVSKGPQNFKIIIGGSSGAANGGSMIVSTNGVLTVTDNALQQIVPSKGNSISLTGRTLDTNLVAGPNEFSSGKYNAVTLGSTTGNFTVNATTAAELKNGIRGTVTAEFVNLSGPTGLIVKSGDITGSVVSLNTSKFQLNDTSNVIGQAMGSTKAANVSLSISNLVSSGLTIGGTAGLSDPGGNYSGFASVLIQASGGLVNVGQLFTSSKLLGNGTVTNLAISGGSVTLPSTLQNLQVAPGGQIFLNAGTLTYTPKNTNPFPYLTLDAQGGSVTLQLTPSVTLGQFKGALDISVGTTGSYTVNSGGTLKVSEALNTASGVLTARAVTLTNPISTTGLLQITATSQTPAGITAGSNIISAGTLQLSENNMQLPTAAGVLNISSPNVVLGSGALSIVDTFAGDVQLSQTFSVPSLLAVNFVSTTGLAASTLTLNSIATGKGSIQVVANNGHIAVADGAKLLTTLGNIIIQNNDLVNGTIDIGKNALIYASSTAAAQGFVAIQMGPNTFLTIAPGTQPGPNAPVTLSSGSAKVFYTTTAFPLGTITSFGVNTLNAKGRLIIFNGNGNNSAITLEGGDTIIADPPVDGPATSSATLIAPTISAGSNFSANTLSIQPVALNTMSLSSTINQASLLPINNWALPTMLSIGDGLGSGLQASNLMPEPGAVCTQAIKSSGIDGVGTSRALGGGVSLNSNAQLLNNGVKLVAPKTATKISTPYGDVKVAAGAVAIVMSFDGGLAVYNLHDTASGAVVVQPLSSNASKGGVIKLAPGQSMVLSDKDVASFEEINPARNVAYRCISAKTLGSGMRAFTAEFSVLSMLQNVDSFAKLMSSNVPETKRMMQDIIKTSAIMMQLGGAPYQYAATPRLASTN